MLIFQRKLNPQTAIQNPFASSSTDQNIDERRGARDRNDERQHSAEALLEDDHDEKRARRSP